jgi:hypothetical protein
MSSSSHPNLSDESDDSPDAFGPMSLADAYTARESVLGGTPDVGIEIVLVSDVADLFKRLPLP